MKQIATLYGCMRSLFYCNRLCRRTDAVYLILVYWAYTYIADSRNDCRPSESEIKKIKKLKEKC